MVRDLVFAFRILRRASGFTGVALIVLAIGIGANTAIFTAVNAVLLQPLSFRDPTQLVILRSSNPGAHLGDFPLSPPDFFDYRAQNTVFSGMSLVRSEPFLVVTGEGAERLAGTLVSPEFFDLLGVRPVVGRGFRGGEDHTSVAVISNGLWQRRFGGRPDMLNRAIELNSRSYTVIGIAPQGFDFPAGAQVWVPFELGEQQLRGRSLRYAGAIARLRPSVSIAQARAELETIAAHLAKQYPADDSGWQVRVRDLQENMVGGVRPAMLTLTLAVGVVLLIACANIANLLLARSLGRRREISIRTALGAGKARLVRQLLAESLLLSFTGAGLGLGLAVSAIRLFVHTSASLLPRAGEIRLNTPVLIFTAAIAILSGLLFGLAPALQLARRDIVDGLREAGHGASVTAGRNRSRAILIIAEVSLAIVLLSSAGLLMRSYLTLSSVDPGFQREGVVVFRATSSGSGDEMQKRNRSFFSTALGRFRALPDVTAAGAADGFPMASGQTLMYISIPGRASVSGAKEETAAVRFVTPGYFEAMGIRLKSGRFPADADASLDSRVCMVNAALAGQYFPAQDPIGRNILMGGPKGRPCTIVGVVADIHEAGLDIRPIAAVYQPSWNRMSYLVVRSTLKPAVLIPQVRAMLEQIDRTVAVEVAGTAFELVAASYSRARMTMLLITVFAGFALALALIGIYGLMAYLASQSRREISIRIALGAQRRDILLLMFRYGSTLLLPGLAIGIPAALAAGRMLQSQLFEIQPADPLTLLAVSILLIGAGLPACLFPAYRATREDPMEALRYE